eukprot:2913668-Pyramimonas_sp.AAC.1
MRSNIYYQSWHLVAVPPTEAAAGEAAPADHIYYYISSLGTWWAPLKRQSWHLVAAPTPAAVAGEAAPSWHLVAAPPPAAVAGEAAPVGVHGCVRLPPPLVLAHPAQPRPIELLRHRAVD